MLINTGVQYGMHVERRDLREREARRRWSRFRERGRVVARSCAHRLTIKIIKIPAILGVSGGTL